MAAQGCPATPEREDMLEQRRGPPCHNPPLPFQPITGARWMEEAFEVKPVLPVGSFTGPAPAPF